MEVTSATFPDYLPFILNDISVSCFVSLDFELSGLAFAPFIPTKPQTLQERYEQTKAAAEKYQILQVGLTICHENLETASYCVKPYNFNLNPIPHRDSEVNRDWTSSSRAMEFLLRHGFSMKTMCQHGIQYLSRAEEQFALARAKERYNQTPRQDMDIKEDDHKSLEFLAEVRTMITDWLAKGKDRAQRRNLLPSNQEVPLGIRSDGYDAMQKWLVHQLVANEFPNLRSRTGSKFIQIDAVDVKSEQAAEEQRVKIKKAQLQKHIGFRWVAESLVGGNLEELGSEMFRPLMRRIKNPTYGIDTMVNRVKTCLQINRPVLVGHNMFCDLLFFHACFLGPLPDTIEEFQTAIHKLFPVLIDTKYLDTYDCGSTNPASSLADLHAKLMNVDTPKIELDPRFTKYRWRAISHEAGYDSMICAMAFIKLAGQIQRGDSIPSPPKSPDIEDEEASPVVEASDHVSLPTTLADTGCPEIHALADKGVLLPRLGSKFWEDYGNRLRVFGTMERMVRVGVKTTKESHLLDMD
ncbi:uncharacterized protein N7511_002275 [Penicillium nucicola]|uniref:uncharacterized protein n=1 Tax=Penicillium nucicola TaxID=1850975 RepID=UPI0025458C66|nr:uncharacterized protein N7511_002275 [Penicillium nucicola]KAJ5770224.1 hypothetical protein N7511_002275 [Penicillium nucicola]